MPPVSAPCHWCIDAPVLHPIADRFTLRGWVAADGPVDQLALVGGTFAAFTWIDRPDLVPPPDGRAWARGFHAQVPQSALVQGALHARATIGPTTTELIWPFAPAIDPGRKHRKLDRIQALLQPGAQPRRTPHFLSFLPPTTCIEEPALTSGYHYPPWILELIQHHSDGLILDCGAGNRPEYLDNVVNLEIAPYPSTDVLADAEQLPFRDNSFDAIVTLAVLEHIRRPWLVARELVRVLKPGGTLIADVQLLQPVHAYPSHFFNMTSEGLQSLFADSCDIEQTTVPHYGRPIYTLTWLLQRYADGLPAASRARFLDLRVADLLAPIKQQLPQDYVTQLPKPFEFELASVTSITARKR